MYLFTAPYFLILGFFVFDFVFPYKTGIILGILLGELFGRILFNLFKTKYTYITVPLAFYVFDFAFTRIPGLNYMEMPPLMYNLYKDTPIIYLISFFGRHIALFIVVYLISCAAHFAVQRKIQKGFLIVLSAFLIAGTVGMSRTYYQDESLEIKAAVVQGSYMNPGMDDYESMLKHKAAYYMNIAGDSDTEADIVVFPETLMGYYDTENIIDKDYRSMFTGISEKLDALAVFTVIEGSSITKAKQDRFLSALLVDEDGVKGITRKRNLVPFSESSEYSKGTSYEAHDTGFGRIGIAICYDFNSTTVEKLKKNGAQIILAPFNDSSFGKIYQRIHRFYPICAAAENNVCVASANENGISQIIDNLGRVKKELLYKETGVMTASLPLKDLPGPYLYFGKYFQYFLMIYALYHFFKFYISGQLPFSRKKRALSSDEVTSSSP